MHNKIHSVISPLFRIKNADTETGWNVQILRSVWIISAEIRYLLSEQKKFQNKSKNIDEVYQSVFFRCIMFLSYRVTFLCNVLGQIHYTSESPVRYFFYEKVVKWCYLHKQCVKYRYHNYGKADHCCRYKKRICTEINFSFFLIPSLLHTKTCGFYKSRRFFPCFFKLSKLFFNFHMLSVHTLSAPDFHTLYDPSAHLHLPGYPVEAQSCLFRR